MSAEGRQSASWMLRGAPGIAVVVASALMLGGCAGVSAAPASVALSEVSGFPADAPIAEPLFDQQWNGEPVGWLADDRTTLTIVSYWSSACPFIATAIEVVDDALLTIELRRPLSGACTDDLAPRTHVIAVPDGWGSGDGPYSARVVRSPDALNSAMAPTTVVLWPVPTAVPTTPPTEGGTPVVDDSIAIETIRGIPDGITLPDGALEKGEPLAFWGDGRLTLRVITWGSSSCPPPALSLATSNADELTIMFGALGPVACTADFAPATHVLITPEGVASAAVALTITIEQRDAASLQYRIIVID